MKTQDQVLRAIHTLLNDFYTHDCDKTFDKYLDILMTQKSIIRDEEVSQDELQKTYQSLMFLQNSMKNLRKVNFIFG